MTNHRIMIIVPGVACPAPSGAKRRCTTVRQRIERGLEFEFEFEFKRQGAEAAAVGACACPQGLQSRGSGGSAWREGGPKVKVTRPEKWIKETLSWDLLPWPVHKGGTP